MHELVLTSNKLKGSDGLNYNITTVSLPKSLLTNIKLPELSEYINKPVATAVLLYTAQTFRKLVLLQHFRLSSAQ